MTYNRPATAFSRLSGFPRLRALGITVPAALALALMIGRVWSGLPEPGITIYGRVFDQGVLITTGELTWTYTPQAGGDPIVVSVPLELTDNGLGQEFSYAVFISAERVIASMATSPGALPLTGTAQPFDRTATIDGVAASIVEPAMSTVEVSISNRGQADRVDLVLGGQFPDFPDLPANPMPISGATNVIITTMLDWDDSTVPATYDVFLWLSGAEKPATPTAVGLIKSQFDPGPLALASSYLWQVVATNPAGNAEGFEWAFTTASSSPPIITLHPSSRTVNQGRRVTLAVEAIGAELTYQWVKSGTPIDGATAGTLVFTSITTGDAGGYRAEVTNSGGTTVSNTAVLSVPSPEAANDAVIVSYLFPEQLKRRAPVFFNVIVRNTSALTWTAEQGFALGVLNDAGGIMQGIGEFAIRDESLIVGPQEELRFRGGVGIPPSFPTGEFTVQFQMKEGAFGFFGEILSVTVTVPNAAQNWELYR